jgi:hypothetical protein
VLACHRQERAPDAEARAALPVVRMEQEIMETVVDNDVVILCGETGSGSLFCRCDPMPIGFLQRLLRSTTRSSWPQGLCSSLQHLLHGQVGQRLCRIRCVPSSGCGGSANGQARVTCHCSARDLGDSGWHPGWALNRSLRKPPHPGWAPHLLLPR